MGLTVEDAAAISAFVQELHSRSIGAHPADEETLALRMLASANADADYDLTHVKSLDANANAPAAMDAGSGDAKFDQFVKLMMGDIKDPKDQVAEGLPPKAPPVVVHDVISDDPNLPKYDLSGALANYQLLNDAHSVAQMFTNIMLTQIKPEGYDIIKEADVAFSTQASLAYKAMTGPMGGIYNFGQGQVKKFDMTVAKKDVHDNLLSGMFAGIKIDVEHKKQIDDQLTAFVASLQNITVGGTNPTVDWALRFGLTPGFNITADPANVVMAYQPTTYLIYLKLDANSWSKSISKNNSQDMIRLKYEQTITTCELNVNFFNKMKPKWEKMLLTATGKSLKEYGDMLNKPVKK